VSDSSENITLFDKYHHQLMTTDEMSLFENRMKEDENLRVEYEQYMTAIQLIEHTSIFEEIAGVVNENERETVTLSRKRWLGLSVAATISIIVIAALWWRPIETNYQSLYHENFEAYQNITSFRGDGDVEITVLLFDAYNRMKFDEVIELYHQHQKTSDTLQLYTATSYMKELQSNEALDMFSHIDASSVFYEQVNWYSALAFLQKEEVDSCRNSLQKINAGEFNYDQAKVLFNMLKEVSD